MGKLREAIGRLGHRIADFEPQKGLTGAFIEWCWRVGYPAHTAFPVVSVVTVDNYRHHVVSYPFPLNESACVIFNGVKFHTVWRMDNRWEHFVSVEGTKNFVLHHEDGDRWYLSFNDASSDREFMISLEEENVIQFILQARDESKNFGDSGEMWRVFPELKPT